VWRLFIIGFGDKGQINFELIKNLRAF